MKIVQINATCGIGSTGKICVAISKLLNQRNIENYILYTSGNSDYPQGIRYANDAYIKVQALKTRITGSYGFTANRATKRLISHLERIQPDIVHLHNLHSHNCNLEMLFSYLKTKPIRIFWTFHDCWAFTGHCSHFVLAKCEQWKYSCEHCPMPHEMNWIWDTSHKLFMKKKRAIEGADIKVFSDSEWLSDLIRQSIFKQYPIRTIANGIDLEVFAPTESTFRAKHGLTNKFIVLGVAFGWGKRKGVDVFIELAKRLNEQYRIVLVGTNEATDKQLPDNIISIHRTQNQKELAEIYTAADVFANPTREEVFGLVNVEALACGTPVLTFRTGGSPECIDETCGSVVECDDVDAMEREIIRICETKPYSKDACLKRASKFDMNERFEEYVEMYEQEMIERNKENI